MVQGTAFYLTDIGLVTCDHVLGSATHAFHYSNPSVKYPITILRRHKVIDLAVLAFDGTAKGLRAGNPASLKVMDHILVAGHPNYSLGDSPMISPGIVAGFRVKSGIRRIVTNAPIVAGTSGGPVLGQDGLVIGVAVTGSDKFANAASTEDHAIIPIDALGLLPT